MSVLKEKSEVNFKSAELLKINSYHCAAVHSAYYSCLQMMKHLLFEKAGFDEDTLRAAQTGKDGTHMTIIKLVRSFLKARNQSFREFHREIVELKKMRVDADYTTNEVNLSQCNAAIFKSNEVLKILKPLI